MLYICATPIGNLEDITLRVLRVLKEADMILAEDTRHTKALLNHYTIENRLLSLHQHNEAKRQEEILSLLREDKSIALVSDAGLPGISDPGGMLIQKVAKEKLPMTVLPGANAALTGLILSGMPMDAFYYLGFLPRKKGEKKRVLEEVGTVSASLVFYEAPHRLLDTLQSLLETLGNREAAVCRELTKKYEEIRREKLKEHLQYYAENAPRGEIVLVVEGYRKPELSLEGLCLLELVQDAMRTGSSKKEATKQVAKTYGLPRNQVYQEVLDLSSDGSDRNSSKQS